jgi:predicted ATPase
VNQPGFHLTDEPDAPLSFTACLGLAGVLHDLAKVGSQAVVATHSPIVAAVPGASIFKLGDWGIRSARWDELRLVGDWRRSGEPSRAWQSRLRQGRSARGRSVAGPSVW